MEVYKDAGRDVGDDGKMVLLTGNLVRDSM